MRCSDLRMGLAAITVLLPVVLTAAYGIAKGDNAEAQMTVAAQPLQPVVAFAKPSVAAAASAPAAPLTLTAASEVATVAPAVATADALREAHAKHHHPAKGHHPHRAG